MVEMSSSSSKIESSSSLSSLSFSGFSCSPPRVDKTTGIEKRDDNDVRFPVVKLKLSAVLAEKPKLMLSSRHKKRKGTYAEKKETIKKEDAERRESNFNENNKKVSSHTTHAGGVPNLYEQFHLLVAIQAFALTNAPETCLRTSLENMLSMTEKDPETGE